MATTPTDPPPSPHSQLVIDLTSNDTNQPNTTVYPTIGELLRELDNTVPGLGFTHYEEGLSNAGFSHVHQVTDIPEVHQRFDQLAIPVDVQQQILERATRMTRRAEKSKEIPKSEGSERPSI